MISVNDGNPPVGLSLPPNVPVPQFDASAALAQIATFNQQIADSEANLRAQFESIELQKEVMINLKISVILDFAVTKFSLFYYALQLQNICRSGEISVYIFIFLVHFG